LQGKLQQGLISLGKFDAVIDGVLSWLDNANKSLDDAPPVYGNPKEIETELSKLRVSALLTAIIICFTSLVLQLF